MILKNLLANTLVRYTIAAAAGFLVGAALVKASSRKMVVAKPKGQDVHDAVAEAVARLENTSAS